VSIFDFFKRKKGGTKNLESVILSFERNEILMEVKENMKKFFQIQVKLEANHGFLGIFSGQYL